MSAAQLLEQAEKEMDSFAFDKAEGLLLFSLSLCLFLLETRFYIYTSRAALCASPSYLTDIPYFHLDIYLLHLVAKDSESSFLSAFFASPIWSRHFLLLRLPNRAVTEFL